MQCYTPKEPPATPGIQTNYQHPAPPSTSERVSDYPADFRGAFAQQWHLIHQWGDAKPDPPKRFITDLDTFLAPHHSTWKL